MKTTAYHGTVWGGFEKFNADLQPDYGMFFSDDQVVAEGYADTDEHYTGPAETHPCVYEVVLTLNNPLIIDAEGAGYGDIDGLMSRDWARIAKNEGRDGLVINNVVDCGPFAMEEREATIYAVFSSDQIEIVL